MANTHPKPGQRTYVQVKVSIDPSIAHAFKAACQKSNVSMAAMLTSYMAQYSRTTATAKHTPDYSSRRKRRESVRRIVSQLEIIRDAEEGYRDNIPENLKGSILFENAEHSITAIDDALDLLASAY